MATGTALCVDQDESSVAAMKELLESRGFSVYSEPNGDKAVDWARKNPPQLIVVCVEPRKVGYAVCNKIKRATELKDVPLVLTSAEETQQTFEQHQKLKSCAEGYVFKPIDRKQFGDVVDRLTAGETHGMNSEEIILTSDLEEEISMADIVVDDQSGGRATRAAASAKPMSIGADTNDLASIFDQETDDALAALSGSAPVVAAAVPRAADFTPTEESWLDERTRAQPRRIPELPTPPLVVPSAVEAGADEAVPLPVLATNSSSSYEALEGGSEFSPQPTLASLRKAAIQKERDDSKIKDLEARVRSFETEREQLTEELADAKNRISNQPLSKEKDLLSLREIINRKEKDILDLRDSLDAKERQTLDHKDRIREHERARRDLEEKALGFEKILMAANEKVAALQHDKDKSLEREKGTKARLDAAQSEIQKAHAEIDTHKKRVVSVEEKAKADLDRARVAAAAKIAELEEAQRAGLLRLTGEHAGASAQREKEFEAEKKRFADAVAAANERLATEHMAHQATVESRERDHKNEVVGLRHQHEQELATADERRIKELAEAEDRVLQALQKLRSDDKAIDQAKRALAVALTWLDERGASPQQGASPGGPVTKAPSEEGAT